jgi:glyoxylase I family protein
MEKTSMKIEHFAYQVEKPVEVADWYCEHLGFTVKRSMDEPVPCRFLADETGSVMIEIYNNPKVTAPDYGSMDPLLLHLAFVCPDVSGTVDRLTAAGAELVAGPETLPDGDELAMLRDPWGLAIQFVNRADPMV